MPPAVPICPVGQDVPSVDATVKELVGNFEHLRHGGSIINITLFRYDIGLYIRFSFHLNLCVSSFSYWVYHLQICFTLDMPW